MQVDAATLTQIYQDNELAADKQYENKIFKVSGFFNVTSDVLGHKTVHVAGTSDGFSVVDVYCTINSEQINIAVSLSNGTPVKVVGKNTGFDGLTVSLDDCTIKQ